MAQVSLKAITSKRARTAFNVAGLQSESRKQMTNYLKKVRNELIANYEEVSPTARGAKLEGRTTERTKRTGQWVRGLGDRKTRSQNMRAQWHIQVNGDGSNGFLFNTATYAVYVQGPRGSGRRAGQRQAAHMRRIGWRSITDVARETYKEFVVVMNRAYGPSPTK